MFQNIEKVLNCVRIEPLENVLHRDINGDIYLFRKKLIFVNLIKY